MSFQRKMDGQQGVFSRSINQFNGWHSGYSEPDEPDSFARVSDFDVSEKNLELRDGSRKNQGWGYPASVTSLLSFSLGGRQLLGQVTNGVLTIYPVEDILEGIRTYYTISEVSGKFTVSELDAKTINDLIIGNR